MVKASARLRPRLFAALLGMAVGGAMLAHGMLYALIGEGHDFGGVWHGAFLALALTGLGWALADRRRNGLAGLGLGMVPALAGLQLAAFLAVEAGEGHLSHLAAPQILLALLLLIVVAALVGRSLPAVARAVDGGALRIAAPAGFHTCLADAQARISSAWLVRQHAPRAPPVRP
ncbi:hypothetical protein EPN44_12450 [bacterium]|nr:MAG: hypothetical protein EPN44_12450 [bacterium]